MEHTMTEFEIFEKIKFAKKRYSEQKGVAKTRNIEWQFTFETWWKMWSDSGKWELRGNKKGHYCMARFKDEGPYGPDNVEIILASKNASDAHANNRVTYGTWKPNEEQIEAMRIRATGVKQSDETRAKKSIAFKGKPWPEARRLAYEKARAEGRVNPGNFKIGHKQEYEQVTCPHCGKQGAGPAMQRHHFDRCKHKQ